MKRRNRARKSGLPPGTLVHIGERKADEARIALIDYGPEELTFSALGSATEAAACRKTPSVSWINVTGLHDTKLLEEIGREFEIHPLLLEDIANTDQRPKLDPGDKQIYLVAKMLKVLKNDRADVDVEQVSFILGPNYLLTFQEKEGDVFEPVRERIRQSKGRIRKSGPDYLAYALLDVMIDNYFIVLESLSEEIDELEERILQSSNPEIPLRVHRLRQTLLLMRKAAWPLREIIAALLRDESPLVKASTLPFLRDLHDHAIYILDTLEFSRDRLSGLLEIHFSNLNSRMSEVMKVLTIIATLFIPLTFLTSLYGMNFERMPELHWRWGYPLLLAVMFLLGTGMLIYFRRKKWL